jgi:hypothetical protein
MFRKDIAEGMSEGFGGKLVLFDYAREDGPLDSLERILKLVHLENASARSTWKSHPVRVHDNILQTFW